MSWWWWVGGSLDCHQCSSIRNEPHGFSMCSCWIPNPRSFLRKGSVCLSEGERHTSPFFPPASALFVLWQGRHTDLVQLLVQSQLYFMVGLSPLWWSISHSESWKVSQRGNVGALYYLIVSVWRKHSQWCKSLNEDPNSYRVSRKCGLIKNQTGKGSWKFQRGHSGMVISTLDVLYVCWISLNSVLALKRHSVGWIKGRWIAVTSVSVR